MRNILLTFTSILFLTLSCLGATPWTPDAFVSVPKSHELAEHLDSSNRHIPDLVKFFSSISLPPSAMVSYSPKTMASAYRTLWNKKEKAWDVQKLNDTLRAKVVVDSVEDVYKVMEKLKGHPSISVDRIKDKYKGETEEGYYAIHLRATIEGFSGRVVELQIVDEITNRVNQWSRLFFTDTLFDKYLDYRERVGEAGAQVKTGVWKKVSAPWGMPKYLEFTSQYLDASVKSSKDEKDKFFTERVQVFEEEKDVINMIQSALVVPDEDILQKMNLEIQRNQSKLFDLQMNIDRIKKSMEGGDISRFNELLHSREIREELIFINRMLKHGRQFLNTDYRIGFFFGTFDPLHKGHLRAVMKGKQVIPFLKATYLIPNLDTSHKPGASAFEDRLAELRKFESELAKLGIFIPSDSDFEVYKRIIAGSSSTHHKNLFMNYLSKRYGKSGLSVQIIGVDSFNKLRFESDIDDQMNRSFVVLPRDGDFDVNFEGHYSEHVFTVVDFDSTTSSTRFREALASGDQKVIREHEVNKRYLDSLLGSFNRSQCEVTFF